MATLKEHQAAMVDLLANGSGIPASASRLAHAMHDVLEVLTGSAMGRDLKNGYDVRCDATTPGLNDKAFSKREKALKTDSPAKWPTPAEQRVKELENTCKQLRQSNKELRGALKMASDHAASLESERDMLHGRLLEHEHPTEQAGCRKPDTQICEHEWLNDGYHICCRNCGAEE